MNDKSNTVSNFCKVTVVIPTANRDKLLSRSIDSVLQQSFLPFEIVVVDNGNERCYINKSTPASVRIIRATPNIGASKARNIGLANVKTEFVAFLDDDDIWDKEYLRYLMDVICHVECDVVVGALYRRQLKSNRDILYKQFPSNYLSQRKVYYSNPGFGGQNFLCKTDFLKDLGGFDEDLVGAEDRDLAARIIENNGKFESVPSAIAVLCDHQGPRYRYYKKIKGLLQFISRHRKYMSTKELFFAYIKLLDHLQKILRRKFFTILNS